MTAVVTIEGIALVLPHVTNVGRVESMGVRHGWAVNSGLGNTWFSFPSEREANDARDKFIQALVDYWAAR